EIARLAAQKILASSLDTSADKPDRWWMWTDHAGQPMGWTHVTFEESAQGPSTVRAVCESRWREPDRRAVRVLQRWACSGELRSYEYDVRWGELSSASGTADDSNAAADSAEQLTRLSRGKLGTELAIRGRSVPTTPLDAPSNFLPGATLPLLMSKM